MEKNIIIYDNESDIEMISQNKYNLKFNLKIYLLYDLKFCNPAYFDNIYLFKSELKTSDLKMLYNMIKVGGNIIFYKKYKYFFTPNKKCDIGYKMTKTINNIYTLDNWRTVDFIIMGTQKGGTTALSSNIGMHPDIGIDRNSDPTKSEIHYFDIYYSQGLAWYKKHFDYSKKIVGEKTPELMYLDWTHPFIQSVNPYLKIILILNNPIERAHSAWKLMVKNGGENLDFESAIENELKNKLDENKTFYTAQTHYLQRGLYYSQITNLLKWFPKDNILILISANVKSNMNYEYSKVYNFLNLDPWESNDYKLEFVSKDKSRVNPDTYKIIKKFYESDVKQLEKFIGYSTNWFDN